MSTRGLDRPVAAAQGNRFADRYGPWAVVTGASDGIGREVAREVAHRGLNVALVARRGEMLRTLCVELNRSHGIECISIAANLATAEGCAAVSAAIDRLEVGLLVAAAGFGTSGDFVHSSLEAEHEMLSVNCTAVLKMVGHVAPTMKSRGRGGIVLFSSVLAFQGVRRSAHYAATKAWVQAFAEGLRAELGPAGVDVLASAPGPVDTGFATRANLKMGAALSPEVVARETVGALGRRGTVRPGWLSKLLGWSLAILPRAGRVVVLSMVMEGMTAHQRARGEAAPG